MENISQIHSTIRNQEASPDILVISRNFLPKNKEFKEYIDEYIYNRCLQEPERVLVLTSDDKSDKKFDIYPTFYIYPWQFLRNSWASIFASLFEAISSLVLAVKLYFRYHYQYIEWGHGYDYLSILLLSYILPIRFFIYLHGNDIISPNSNPLSRWLFELALKRAKGIVCNSHSTKFFLENNFKFPTVTHVINPKIRPEKFSVTNTSSHINHLRAIIRGGYRIPETATLILSVGNIVKNNGFDRVIETLTILLTYGIDVYYIICGRGSMETELQSLVSRLRLQGRVHFVGAVSNRELAGYYAACDIFSNLNLSKVNNFTLPTYRTTYLEASYFGKPVIASNNGDTMDAVRHQVNGILVNPHSGNEVFQAFKKLCQNSKLREKLGRNGQLLTQRKVSHRLLYT